MKGNAPPTPKQGPKRTSSAKSNALRDINPPFEASKKVPARTRSGKSDSAGRSVSMVEPSARKELLKTRSGGLLELRASTLRANDGSARDERARQRNHDLIPSNPTKGQRPGSVNGSTSIEAKGRASTSNVPLAAPSPSADGWGKPAAIAATRTSHKQQPVTKQVPSSTGWSNPSALAAKRRDG